MEPLPEIKLRMIRKGYIYLWEQRPNKFTKRKKERKKRKKEKKERKERKKRKERRKERKKERRNDVRLV